MSTTSANINCVPSYLDEVLRIARLFKSSASPDEVDGPWFRGAGNLDHGLLPGLLWREVQDERGLVTEFYDEAPPYLTGVVGAMQPSSPWEWYFLMQHYGIPTRLLDWTENALVGLFFALHTNGSAPCVWVLDPAQFNKLTIQEPCVLSVNGELSKPWLPFPSDNQVLSVGSQKSDSQHNASRQLDSSKPIAIYAPRKNARILAQQGTFTVHGSDRRPLESFVPGVGQSPLSRVVLDSDAREKMIEELELCGVTERRLFPELDRLAPYLKKRHRICA